MVTYYAKVTSKGQLTLPVELRRRLHIDTGETIAFDVDEDGSVALRSPRHILEAAFGSWSLPDGMTALEAIKIARDEMERDAVERYRETRGE